eukprot:CAMPEP_0174877268 /NCGR_PEP_ID=MMETSP1114-20130205/81612_1 /TAXON_ID=312471 /ORGANISM="Neobodo designis, Strain CCAP 1951/1" /LENGTH=259 /DNA_ID=CAMNT_0016112645 /DNA_START=206 /DNA_END=982 /DNA_ORIENTATION=-
MKTQADAAGVIAPAISAVVGFRSSLQRGNIGGGGGDAEEVAHGFPRVDAGAGADGAERLRRHLVRRRAGVARQNLDSARQRREAHRVRHRAADEQLRQGALQQREALRVGLGLAAGELGLDRPRDDLGPRVLDHDGRHGEDDGGAALAHADGAARLLDDGGRLGREGGEAVDEAAVQHEGLGVVGRARVQHVADDAAEQLREDGARELRPERRVVQGRGERVAAHVRERPLQLRQRPLRVGLVQQQRQRDVVAVPARGA